MSARVPRGEGPRFPWFLITGLVIGILAGASYAWYISPAQYRDAPPSALSEQDKDRYRGLAALAYLSNGDRWRAETRLNLLGDSDVPGALAASVQRFLAGAGPAEEAGAMADLAAVLREPAPDLPTPAPLAISSPIAEAATPTPTQPVNPTASTTPAEPTFTPFPTYTPAPTATTASTTPFVLSNLTPICDRNVKEGLLQVQVEDTKGKPLPGVKVTVTWKDGQDFFFTGLAPEISPGYADYQMAPGVVYSVQLGDSGDPTNNVAAKACASTSGSSYLGGVRLRYKKIQ